MHTFTDNLDRKWNVSINVATVKRVRVTLDVDLLQALGGDLFRRLVGDPVLLCDVLYVVCKPQADAAGVSDEDFGAGLGGDAIDRASTAFLEELTLFFQSPKDRLNLRSLIEATNLGMDRARDVITQRMDPERVSKAIDAAIAEMLPPLPPGDSSGDAPESSASTPTSSPSANSS